HGHAASAEPIHGDDRLVAIVRGSSRGSKGGEQPGPPAACPARVGLLVQSGANFLRAAAVSPDGGAMSPFLDFLGCLLGEGRFVPGVYHRARALDPADALAAGLARLLRLWPLSGVLADLEEGPLTPPTLGGHPGLLLLYAERLADHFRPAWLPEGPAGDYFDLV